MHKNLISAIIAASCSMSFAAEKAQVIPPERLANYWLLLSGTAKQANAPNAGRNLDAPSCAAVAYVVEKDGSTSHVELKRLVPDGDLGKVALGVVQDMQFARRRRIWVRRRVSTYVVIRSICRAQNSTQAADIELRKRTLDACKLDGLAPRTRSFRSARPELASARAGSIIRAPGGIRAARALCARIRFTEPP